MPGSRMMAAISLTSSHELYNERTETHVVEPGETLWTMPRSVDE